MSASASRTEQRLALGVEYLGIAGVDRHARTDGGLRQVHRRYVTALEMCECRQVARPLSAVMNSRRVAVGASTERGRQTRMMLEARALVPILTAVGGVQYASARCR